MIDDQVGDVGDFTDDHDDDDHAGQHARRSR